MGAARPIAMISQITNGRITPGKKACNAYCMSGQVVATPYCHAYDQVQNQKLGKTPVRRSSRHVTPNGNTMPANRAPPRIATSRYGNGRLHSFHSQYDPAKTA